MVELVLVTLRAFDGKQPCMGRTWLLTKTLKKHVLSLQNQSFSLLLNLANVIKHQFYHQWKMLMTDLHYAKALFNPYLLIKVHVHDDVYAKKHLIIYYEKILVAR